MVVFGGMASTFGAVVGAAVAHGAAAVADELQGLRDGGLRRDPDADDDLPAARRRADARGAAGGAAVMSAVTLARRQACRKHFGGVQAVARRDVRDPRGHGAFDHRAERRRQDDAVQPAHRRLRAERRAHRLRRRRRSPARRRTRYAAAGIGRTFQNLQIFFNMSGARERHDGPAPRSSACGLAAALLRTPALRRAERESRERALELPALRRARRRRRHAPPTRCRTAR